MSRDNNLLAGVPTGLLDTVADSDTTTAVQVLQLTARLHAARNNAAAWRAVLEDCGEWLGCSGVWDLPHDGPTVDAGALEALAGRVSHCAICGDCADGCAPLNSVRRSRCAAFATHLHEAAAETRNAQRALLFDQLPPIWIVDRNARVVDSNASAKALAAAQAPVAVIDGMLGPDVPGGKLRLQRALATLEHETHFSWPDAHGNERTLHLRVMPGSAAIAITLIPEPPTAERLAPVLAQRLKLTLRQSELAAHLLTDKTLSAAARAMGISRHTAHEHLGALLQRLGVPDRRTLLMTLRRSVVA